MKYDSAMVEDVRATLADCLVRETTYERLKFCFPIG